jgi:NAD(P)-dependent dehydrogenase (short-subunit alcohol dehydrogenase family)
MSADTTPTALIVGASRGLGLALDAEYVDRGWSVIGTVRDTVRTALHELAEASPDRLSVEQLDITEPEQIAALRTRLAHRTIDLLFVNAAVTRGDLAISEVPTEMFVEVMVTNALSPMRVVESLDALVPPTGTIGVEPGQRVAQHQRWAGRLPRQQVGTQSADALLCRPARR